MFPLRDSHSTYKFPFITIVLIIINSVIFFFELTVIDPDVFMDSYALIPSKINFSDYQTLKPFITSQFLHAGFMHIISNMWFLRIFGDNVEEKFGSVRFLLVYLLSGVAGGFFQYLFSPNSDIPMLGASGAVAGILGSYLVFFPRNRIKTLIPFGFYWTTVNVSAYFMLVYWFIIQLFSGVGSISYIQSGGTAFWAHVGGFVMGYSIARFFRDSGKKDYEEGIILE